MILNNNINSVEDLENNIIEYVKYNVNNMIGGGKTTEGRRILKRTIKKGLSDYLNENKKQIKHKKIKLNKDRMEQKISEIFNNKFNNNYNYNNNLNSQMQLFDMFNFYVPLAPVYSRTSISQPIKPELPELTVDNTDLINIVNNYINDTQEYIKKTLGNNPIILSKLVVKYDIFMTLLEELKTLITQTGTPPKEIIQKANVMKDKFEDFTTLMIEHIDFMKTLNMTYEPLNIEKLSELEPMSFENIKTFTESYILNIQRYIIDLIKFLDVVPAGIQTDYRGFNENIKKYIDIMRQPENFEEGRITTLFRLFRSAFVENIGKGEKMLLIVLELNKTFINLVKKIEFAIAAEEAKAIKNTEKLGDMRLDLISKRVWSELSTALAQMTGAEAVEDLNKKITSFKSNLTSTTT
jgi:hypothetical protein